MSVGSSKGNHIVRPGKALGKSIKLKNVKLATSHGKKTVEADLNITPMVDMLTMIVVFLLMTFSATGEILFATKDIVLPPAFHVTELERAPVVAVSKATVGFEGQFVMNAADVTESSYPDWKLTPLFTYLEAERESWMAAHAGEQFKGDVIIQSDQDVPFSMLKLIMSTCAKAQYNNTNFAIRQAGKSEVPLGN
jgi:biopolymer transport protein ExbD